MEQHVDLDLPAEPAAIGEARRCLGSLTRSLPEDALWRAQLLVSELATNVVRHGEMVPQEGHFAIHLRISPMLLRIEVCNSVPPLDRRSPRLPDRGISGGLGLYLVDRIADRWGVDGSCVWVELDLTLR